MALTKEQILGAQDLKTESVEVPEWGGAVIVRSMSGGERDLYEQLLIDAKGKDERIRQVRARLVAFTAVDDAGALLFSEADIEALGAKSVKALDRVFAVAARLNGIGQKEVEDLAKN